MTRSMMLGTSLALGLVLTTAACARRDPQPTETVTRFVVQDEAGFRRRLVLDGVPIRGEVIVVDRNDSTFINGRLYLPRPPMPQDLPAYRFLSPADSIQMMRIPYVSRRAPKSGPILPVVNEFFARRTRMGFEVLWAYRKELERSGDTAFAESLGRARIDPEIFDAGVEHPVRFHGNAVELYTPGYGWEEFLSSVVAPEDPRFSRPNAKKTGEGIFLKDWFERPRTTIVAVLGDATATFYGGSEAEAAADQVDALTDLDTLRGNQRLADLTGRKQPLPSGAVEELRAKHPLRAVKR